MNSADRCLVHPRDQILDVIERIYRYRMTTTSGGNISVREPNGDIWITPARIDKGSLRRDDIVCVRADGTKVGPHPPSSEFPFHKAIYEARPELNAIVHAHPVALVAFSVCRRVPDTRLIPQARNVCGDVGFAPYALPGSSKLGENIARTFAAGHHCVVLENHGVVVGGDDLRQAFARFETLEFAAKTVVKAAMLGEIRYLDDERTKAPVTRVPPLPEFVAERATETEQELRRTLCEFISRGYRQRLFISTEGSFSARIGDDAFLITPGRFDRRTVDVNELVLIRGGEREQGKSPSRAARLHRAIYKRHPEFRAIVNACPVNATAFSATASPLDSRTIPESYIFLKDVARIPFGEQYGDGSAIAERVASDHPVALLENDGALVCGTSVLDAFDRLEVLETTAEAHHQQSPARTRRADVGSRDRRTHGGVSKEVSAERPSIFNCNGFKRATAPDPIARR
ncbi:MAG: class II aldolase/adducin family protein [Pirellulales bacterium]